MGIWVIGLVVYVIARKRDWKISEWLEIVLAGTFLFFLIHI
jgi:hypothetical protein